MAEHTHASQEKIWSHFQNVATEKFIAARPRLEHLFRRMARLTSESSPALLNIGIGDGHLERLALAQGWQVHSLDPDPQAVARLAAAGVQAQVGGIEALPHEAGSLDFVVASEVLEHLTEDQRAAGIRQIARVLKAGGYFLGTVPYNEDLAEQQAVCPHCGEVFHRWGHQRSFTLDDVREQLSPSFTVRELRKTAFVTFRDRSLLGKAKSAVRLLLARAGQPIAVPTIFWLAEVKAR